MEKILMLSDYYVYRIINTETNEFYIGSHACIGTAYSCSDKRCNYSGSSSVIKKSLNKDAWVKQIIAYADNRPALAALEKDLITKYIDHEGCINQVIASPSKRPTYTEESKQRLKENARKRTTKMNVPHIGVVDVEVPDINNRIKQGATFSNPGVWLKNNKDQTMGQFASNTVVSCWEQACSHGWEFGFDRSYRSIKTKELLASIGMKAVRKVVISYEPV